MDTHERQSKMSVYNDADASFVMSRVDEILRSEGFMRPNGNCNTDSWSQTVSHYSF